MQWIIWNWSRLGQKLYKILFSTSFIITLNPIWHIIFRLLLSHSEVESLYRNFLLYLNRSLSIYFLPNEIEQIQKKKSEQVRFQKTEFTQTKHLYCDSVPLWKIKFIEMANRKIGIVTLKETHAPWISAKWPLFSFKITISCWRLGCAKWILRGVCVKWL